MYIDVLGLDNSFTERHNVTPTHVVYAWAGNSDYPNGSNVYAVLYRLTYEDRVMAALAGLTVYANIPESFNMPAWYKVYKVERERYK